MRLYVQKILQCPLHFDFHNLANTHPHIHYADRGLVAAQSGERKAGVLQEVKANFRAQSAGRNRFGVHRA